jgi:hypothetical protein
MAVADSNVCNHLQVARLQDERDDAFREREAALAEREVAAGQVSMVDDLSSIRAAHYATCCCCGCCTTRNSCKAVAHPSHAYALGQEWQLCTQYPVATVGLCTTVQSAACTF